MKTHISSGAIIYTIQDGLVKVLLMYRKATDSWHLPKGTQNHGETLEQTAVREIREETGLDVQLGKYIGKLDSTFERDGNLIQKETHYFLAKPLGGDTKKHDHEHDEICFVEYSDALSRLEHFSPNEKERKILETAESYFV